VDVDVLGEGLPPGVEDGGDAEGAAEMTGVGAEAQKRGGRGVEQEAVEQLGMALGERVEGVREREDDVEVGLGRTSRRRAASQRSGATRWHFGQWRLRQEW
jgi:hypothetical protein